MDNKEQISSINPQTTCPVKEPVLDTNQRNFLEAVGMIMAQKDVLFVQYLSNGMRKDVLAVTVYWN